MSLKELSDNIHGQISEHISRQMEATVFIILQFFFAARAVSGKLGNIFGVCPVLAGRTIQSRDVFRPLASEGKYLMLRHLWTQVTIYLT